jgi:sec-independent protein translocase protein TatB
MWETAMILLVALVVLGPKQLIEVARVAGKLYRDLQKMLWDVKRSVDLDSLLNEPPAAPPPRSLGASSPPSSPETPELASKTGVGSGPDFYAELLESSKRRSEQGAEPSAHSGGEGAPEPVSLSVRPNGDQESSKGK